MDRVLKLAIPPTAATVVVPLSVPPPGLVPMATVTFDVSVLTRLLNWSRTRTDIARRSAGKDSAVVGCRKKARWLAAAGEMLKVPEVVPVRLPSAAVRV